MEMDDVNKFIQYDGNNWEDVLYFCKGCAFYIKEYDYKVSGEIISTLTYNDITIEIGDVVVDIECSGSGDGIVVFSDKDWKTYNKTDDILEVERLLNILMKSVKPEISIFSVLEDITYGSYVIDSFNSGDSPDAFLENLNKYSINGKLCEITKNTDGDFEIDLI